MKKTSRRNFIKQGSMAACSGTAIFAGQQSSGKMKNVFVHHVYFWLKNPGNPSDRKALQEGLIRLSAVKTIRSFHIGKPATTNREVIDTSYALSWLALFENKEDQDSYQSDPIHLKFVEDCSHLWEKVIVYDSVDA